MTSIEPGPPPSMKVVARIDLRTYPRVVGVCRAALLLIGAVGLLFAYAYAPVHAVEDLPSGVNYITHYITLWPWVALWALSGAYSIFSALRPRLNVTGSRGVVGMLGVWGFAYTLAWLTGDPHPRTYLLAGVYTGVSLLLLLGAYVFNTALALSRPPARRAES